jgi:hypothetical protein
VFACLFNEIFKIGLAHGAHFRGLIRFRSTSFGRRRGRRTSLRTTGYRATATIASLPCFIVSQVRHYKTFLVYTPNFHALGQPNILGKLTELTALGAECAARHIGNRTYRRHGLHFFPWKGAGVGCHGRKVLLWTNAYDS